MVGDKGYSGPVVRHHLRSRRIAAVIPTKADQEPLSAFDRAAYRERTIVQRLINRLEQWRRIATRQEKRAANYRAMILLAAILIWL